MTKNVYINHASPDGRVAQWAKLFANYQGAPIAIIDPKTPITDELFATFQEGTTVYGYYPERVKRKGITYRSLMADEKLVAENNRLTALAMKQILTDQHGAFDQKVLVLGHGKLAGELAKVLPNTTIRNLRTHKPDLAGFPIIINTIPQKIITPDHLRPLLETKAGQNPPIIYDLASAPYGFDFGDIEPGRFVYQILPGLPGKFFPEPAARAAYDAVMRDITPQKPVLVCCITASSCCYEKTLPILRELSEQYKLIPVMSANAELPNRFVDMQKFRKDITDMCGHPIINTIAGAETLSSKSEIVASVVLPATGNTIAKLTHAVTDTPVTMAVKALLRNAKPAILGISTNDALGANAANIGVLLNRKHYYFIPFGQDDHAKKPFSMVCHFDKTLETVNAALRGEQIQPIIV